MGCQEVQLIKTRFEFLPPLLLFTQQCRLGMPTASSNYPKTEGEQYCGPHPHRGFDDDGDYLNFLQEVTHYPNDYHHGPSAFVNTLSPIDENPLSSRVDNGPLNALAEPPDFESRLLSGLFHNRQDVLVDGAFCTEGPSPPPPMKLIRDVHDPLLTMVSLGSSAELPSHIFTTDQHASSWGSLRSPLPDRGDQLYPLPFPPGSPCDPTAYIIPGSCSMTRSTSGPTSLPKIDILIFGPILEQAYQGDNGPRSSLSPQTNMVTIQQSTTDSNTAIDEGSNHPVTQRQALGGADGFAELSMTGPCAPSLRSTHPSARPNEEASSPNFRPAILASRHVAWTSPIASSHFAPANETHRKFWCSVCDVGFAQRQGLNRHERDQHGPRNICHMCGTYEWSPARKYLFTKHLKQRHPEAVLA